MRLYATLLVLLPIAVCLDASNAGERLRSLWSKSDSASKDTSEALDAHASPDQASAAPSVFPVFIPNDEIVASGESFQSLDEQGSPNPARPSETCSVALARNAHDLSIKHQFKDGVYRFGRFALVTIPRKLADGALKVGNALRFSWRCGMKGFVLDLVDHFLGDHGYAQKPSGDSPAKKAFGVLTSTIMLASLPFTLAGWLLSYAADKANQKFPAKNDLHDAPLQRPAGASNTASAGKTPALKDLALYSDLLREELEFAYASGDGQPVAQAIDTIAEQLSDPAVVAMAMMNAANTFYNMRNAQGKDTTLAENMMESVARLENDPSQLAAFVRDAVLQEKKVMAH